MHYNEYQAVKLARQLIENDEDEEDDDTNVDLTASGDEPLPHDTALAAAAAVESVHHTGDTEAGHMLTEDMVWCDVIWCYCVMMSNCISQTVESSAYGSEAWLSIALIKSSALHT